MITFGSLLSEKQPCAWID